MAKKPPQLGTIWTAGARLRVIDDSTEPAMWRTIATCIDTPNAIAQALKEARKTERRTIWIKSDTGGNYIPD